MKLLIYSHSFAPAIGGVETYVKGLAQGIAKSFDGANPNAIRVTVATKTAGDGFSDSDLHFRVAREPGFWELCRLVQDADAVFIAGPCLLPMFFACILRKPFAVEHHGYQTICPNGLLFFEPNKDVCPGHFMARRYSRCWKCNRKSGTVRSLTLWLLTFFRRWLSNSARINMPISHHVERRLQLRNSRVVYYGIPDLASRTGTKYADGRSSTICFGYAGRLVSEKGLETLVDAAALLMQTGANFELKFIGDGPERRVLQERVNRVGLHSRVYFTGFLAGDDLRHSLEGITVMVMPSRWEETAGLSAIEQMMLGRLVICSDIGGLGEVVDGTGLKFKPGDSAQLAELMRQVIEEPQIGRQLGECARSRAIQLFTERRMIAEHIGLVTEIVNPRKANAVTGF